MHPLRRPERAAVGRALFLLVCSLSGPERPLTAQDDGATSAPATAPGEETITIEDLRDHIGYLADDKLEGRAAGTKGNDRAADYISKQFKEYGLDKVAEKGRSWFQDFETEGRRYKSVPTRNVLGFLEGTDETLKEEVIVIGGHFDHVGLGNFGSREGGRSNLKDKIHNGADDNASGTSGVLELAEAFAEHPVKRSILFITFSAEELGLLGSYHYCKEPVIPLERTVAMFNFDMIGRSEDDYLFVGGTGTSPIWPGLVEQHMSGAGFRVEQGAGGRAPSDNTPFYERGLPVLFFFTNVHVDYHRVSDEPQFINYGGEERILRAAYRLIREVADAEARPAFQEAEGNGMPASMNALMNEPSRAQDLAKMARGRAMERIDKKGCGRLGFAPATAQRGELMIGEILSTGPAAQAGLDVGDVILAIEGTVMRFSADVAEVLDDVDEGDEVEVTVRQGGENKTVKIVVGK